MADTHGCQLSARFSHGAEPSSSGTAPATTASPDQSSGSSCPFGVTSAPLDELEVSGIAVTKLAAVPTALNIENTLAAALASSNAAEEFDDPTSLMPMATACALT
jgi:hypothetical protein